MRARERRFPSNWDAPYGSPDDRGELRTQDEGPVDDTTGVCGCRPRRRTKRSILTHCYSWPWRFLCGR